MTYLENLTIRLANAVAALPEETRRRHGDFVLSRQRTDGGFAGREGDSDLYYSSFALRTLAVLGLLDGEVAQRAASFLQSKLNSQESIVDFLSLVYGVKLIESASGLNVFETAKSDWAHTVAQALNELRREDGGFAKGPAGKASSTYHTFLVLLCLQLIEQPIADEDAIVRFIMSQEAEDGGFREIRVSKRAGTNPTAAAIGVLRILGAVSPSVREGTLDFLCEMQNDEGGIRANSRIPIADVLSSFTGLLTLIDLDAADEIDLNSLAKYAASLEQSDGGYFGAAWDSVCDVEYTFYGLATTALVALHCNVSR
ncbi:MAG: terpene cyclase/mutase family protein [Planctomycetales bacterium]|nr:terpene cyclase/mutase family protein [Planctomycetales bacterium]